MKQGGPIKRKKPLTGTAIKRAKQLTQRAVQRKRAQVTPEEKAAKKVVRARSQGICERCGRARAAQMHHRVKAGRVWRASNLMHVCGLGNYSGCHGEIEQNPTVSKEQGWWLLPNQDPARSPVWFAGRGRVFLSDDGAIYDEEEDVA